MSRNIENTKVRQAKSCVIVHLWPEHWVPTKQSQRPEVGLVVGATLQLAIMYFIDLTALLMVKQCVQVWSDRESFPRSG